jgi:CelD/BcsL family acetyltransferase involved in cellulose biosynthesis
MLEGGLIADLGELEELYEPWDALAVADGLPQMTPAWVLAWWTHAAPARALPRAVTARDRGRLVGLAPFFVEPPSRGGRVDYRLPGIELAARLAPLALPGREWDVAQTIGDELRRAEPTPDVVALEGLPLASHWQAALRESWPGAVRPVTRRYLIYGCPTVTLGQGSFEAWMAGKSSNFRSQMRRARRDFEAAGGTIRMATKETVSADIAAFARMHAARWEGRGESNLVALGDRLEPLLADVADRLLAEERFRLSVLELDGEPIAAQLFLVAGGTLLYVNNGWREEFGRFKPNMLGILGIVEDAFRRGELRIDLGLGEQSYKLRFADGNDPVSWVIVMAPGARLPLTRLRTAPLLASTAVRRGAKRMLTPEQAQRVAALARRASGSSA